jgi:hypothetical protein
LYQFIIETDNEILKIVNLLNKENNSKEMRQFIDEVLAFIGGNYFFSIGLKRYDSKNLKGFIPLSGHFIYSAFETVIISDKDVEENCGFFKYYFD